MSQCTIAELLEDIGTELNKAAYFINIPEIVDGEEEMIPYRIWGHNMHDTNVDSIMLARQYLLNSDIITPETVPYRGCAIDDWLQKEVPQRYNNYLRDSILETPILMYSADRSSIDTITRKFFTFSAAEVGIVSDDGQCPVFLELGSSPVFYEESKTMTVTYWTRTPDSSGDAYYSITGTGGLRVNSASVGEFVVPCFSLPTSMEVEIGNSSTYDLILPSAGEGISKINVFEVETFDVKDSESVQEIVPSDYGIVYQTYNGPETEIDLTSFVSSIIMNVNKGAMYFTITDSLDITVNSTETKVSFTIT